MVSAYHTHNGQTRAARLPMTYRQARRAVEGCAGRPAARRGFTLVELLAVVAIIGVLVALLLPAVQAAREAARRSSCSNKIVQLIMAVHQYESAQEVYPPGTVDARGPVLNQLKGYHHGWIEQVLPYMENEAVYHHIDGDVSVYHKANMPVRKVRLSWLLCPSNPQMNGPYSHYAALHHDVEASIDVDQNGVFFLNSAVTRDDVSDGIGYTIFLGEKILEGGDLGWLSGTRAILRNTGEAIDTARTQNGQARTWGAIPSLPPGVVDPPIAAGATGREDGSAGMSGVSDLDDQYGTTIVLGGTSPRNAATFVGGFASFHPGGANFAMGDGSTRFLVNTMTMSVYRQLGHRADGELVELEAPE